MANRTDPLVNALSGTDPQNCMEYITRQKIYDSRYWKEECFGLTVADVLEKAAADLQCIGNLPTRFLALVLKLLQLHPETDLVRTAFVEQDQFKYVRAAGCFYIRLTARPADIYEICEPLLADFCKLRVWLQPKWSCMYMDEFVHELLTEPRVLGVALPRLPARRVLEEAGYLETGPRPTALHDVLLEYNGDPLQYLEYKVKVEQSSVAKEAWKQRLERLGLEEAENEERKESKSETRKSKEKRPKKKQRNYDNLFKQSKPKAATTNPLSIEESEQRSDEYWNEQRAQLGLKPLR